MNVLRFAVIPIMLAALISCDQQEAQQEVQTQWDTQADEVFEKLESVLMHLQPVDAETGEKLENIRASYTAAGLSSPMHTIPDIELTAEGILVHWVAPKMSVGRALLEADGYELLYVDPLDDEILSYDDPLSVAHKSQSTEARVVQMRRRAAANDSLQDQP